MPDCLTQGDGDLYGLGVRLGLYLQWLAGLLLRNCNGSWETISSVRIANNVLCFALILTLVVYTVEGSTLSVDYLIVYYLTIALFYSESYNLLEKEDPSSTPKKARSYILRPDMPILAQNLLFAFTSFFGAWFWLTGVHRASSPACLAKGAVFGTFDLQDPSWREFAATMAIITGLIFSFFFAAHAVELLSGPKKGPVTRAFGTAGIVVAEALFAGSGSRFKIKEPNSGLRWLLRPRLVDPRRTRRRSCVGFVFKFVHWSLINLAGPLVAIVSAEKMLRANRLQTPGVSDSTGQMIALVTGVSSICVALSQVAKGIWIGEEESVEDVVMRDVYRSSQVRGWGEKARGQDAQSGRDLGFQDGFSTGIEQYSPRVVSSYVPKLPKSLLEETDIAPTAQKDVRLINAVKQNQDEVVKDLLSEGIDPNTRDREGRTALHWAVIQLQLSTVQLLCAHSKTDMNCKDVQYGRTPLAWAASLGSTAITEYLLSLNQISINSEDRYRQTPLTEAAREGNNTSVADLLLEKGVNIDHPDQENRTPLFWAAKNGHEAMTKLLMRKSANPNAQDRLGHTPLFWAAGSGHTDTAQALIQHGARTNLKDIFDQTPLTWAARNGRAGFVEFLMRHNLADLNALDKYGRTPLCWAAMNGHAALVDILLQRSDIEPSLRDMDGRTPLIWAGINGHEAVCKSLLEKTGSAALEIRDEYGQTALSMAMQNGHREAVYALLRPFSFRHLDF